MSWQEQTALQKNSNVVWMPTTLGENQGKHADNRVDQAYYRSQAFSAHVGINPLVASAYPLLTLATRLTALEEYHDLTHLYQMLLHEIKVFENQAAEKEYRQSSITIASYLLCSLLDETIIQLKWGKTWEHCSLLTAFHHEEPSKERVFHVIDRLLQHPSQHLEVLELAYLCLSFGLKNTEHENSTSEFLEKLDKTYRCIREERGEISQGLLVSEHPASPTKGIKRQYNLTPPTTLFISIGILAVAYYAFSYALKLLATPLIQQLSILSVN